MFCVYCGTEFEPIPESDGHLYWIECPNDQCKATTPRASTIKSAMKKAEAWDDNDILGALGFLRYMQVTMTNLDEPTEFDRIAKKFSIIRGTVKAVVSALNLIVEESLGEIVHYMIENGEPDLMKGLTYVAYRQEPIESGKVLNAAKLRAELRNENHFDSGVVFYNTYPKLIVRKISDDDVK